MGHWKLMGCFETKHEARLVRRELLHKKYAVRIDYSPCETCFDKKPFAVRYM